MAAPEPPVPYQVVYSAAVERRFEELAELALARGDGPAFDAALKKFRHRLELFPQFGDPIIDLVTEPGKILNGVIPPIVMRYGLYEERRLVLAVAPPILMPLPKAAADTDK